MVKLWAQSVFLGGGGGDQVIKKAFRKLWLKDMGYQKKHMETEGNLEEASNVWGYPIFRLSQIRCFVDQ